MFLFHLDSRLTYYSLNPSETHPALREASMIFYLVLPLLRKVTTYHPLLPKELTTGHQ